MPDIASDQVSDLVTWSHKSAQKHQQSNQLPGNKKAYFSTKERREVVIESNDIGSYSEALWLDYQRPSMNEIMLRSNCVNTSLTMERVPQSRFNIKLSPNSEFVLSVPLVMHFNLQPPLPLSPPHHILLFFSHHLCFSHSLVCLLSCFWQT